jgi:glutamine amidotransferase
MCRLLLVRSERPFDISKHLIPFSKISENSKEYQGHGWGCAYLQNGEWKLYKNIQPVWKDDLTRFGETPLLLAHARSAFRNQNIQIENNMPFCDGRFTFIFNGELHGVRIKETGRTGAAKIFNYFRRFDRADPQQALRKVTEILRRRTKYIRAMNMILSDREKAYLVSLFNEDSDYFTMRYKKTEDHLVICSDKYPDESGWQDINNDIITVF